MKHCFFCGEVMHETDSTAPLFRYHICEQCNETMEKYTTLIAANNEPNFDEQEPICKIVREDIDYDVYPTGEWATYRSDTILELFGEDQGAKMNRMGRCFVSAEVLDEIKTIYKAIKMQTESEETPT